MYEVDPLKCPVCGGTMKIIAFIEEQAVIEQILRHIGRWKDAPLRPPPPVTNLLPLGLDRQLLTEPQLDTAFYEMNYA